MPIWVIVWLVLTALYGVIAVAVAGEGIAATLLVGVVLFLVIGGLRLLGAIFMGQRIGADKGGSQLLPCPFCAEPIKPKAKICRYCQHELPVGWAEKEQKP